MSHTYAPVIYSLRLLKLFHEIGIYEYAADDIEEIGEDDCYDIAMRGLENVAPLYDIEELGEDCCCGGHVLHCFSDPAMPEYYRLCRLYEHRHSITPEENPYVAKADDRYGILLCHVGGSFASDYDDERHPRWIWIETCPEHYTSEYDMITLVHGMMEFYRTESAALQAELQKGPPVWLPALPPHTDEPECEAKPRAKKKKQKRKRDNQHGQTH